MEKTKSVPKGKTTEKGKSAGKTRSAAAAKTAQPAKSAGRRKSTEPAKSTVRKKSAEAVREPAPQSAVDFYHPSYYTNRELSWLDFNYRILDEARDKTNPLFERLKFLSITASNLDEFFMVRVASLMDMVHAKVNKPDLAGLTPAQQLEQVEQKCHELIDKQYSTLSRSLIPALRNEGYDLVTDPEVLSIPQREYLETYFEETVYPVLTPTAVDASRPFPLIRNKSLNIGALISRRKGDAEEKNSSAAAFIESLQKNGEKIADKISKDKTLKKGMMFATVQVPNVLPRVVRIPSEDGAGIAGVLLEDLIKAHLDILFTGYDVVCAHTYRITRNADMELDEDDSDDLLEEIQSKLKQRQWGEVIRFEYEDSMNPKLLKILRREFNVGDSEMYPIQGPLDLTYLMKLYSLPGSDRLKEKPWTPQPNPALRKMDGRDLFAMIRKQDIFLHHPYQTFDPVVDLIRTASKDPDVLAIKMTLYRVSGNSPIVAALAAAAENGKQVTALVELKARFDEENNIQWAEMLEKAGCHVIYGLVGLKTHSKIALVVRREEDGIRRYVHLATGNYNDSTAKLYTDCGIMTCREAYGEDATAVFNMLSGYSEPRQWNRLYLAPIWLRDAFYMLINREIQHAREHEPAHITAKMNSLCDREIIAKLYEASAAGVKIDLIIRGICCLKVGIPGVSENITVRSIVGTFLEHARIFRFANGGNEEVYMASADWMPRNLDRRVEILFPLEDESCKAQAIHILDVQMADTMKAHVLGSDNTYEKVDLRGKAKIGAQDTLMKEALQAGSDPDDPIRSRTFIPAQP